MSNDATDAAHETRALSFMLAGAAGMAIMAFALGAWLGTPLPPMLKATPMGIASGVAATVPLAALLMLLMRSKHAAVARFRDEQLDFLSGIGFRLTPWRIFAISLAAGVSEELLFRGFAQSWTIEQYGMLAGLAGPSVVFGLLHARNAAYAAIAGLVGLYLGMLFVITGDLVAPIVTHAIYDYIALDVTRRALAGRSSIE
jgi:membrane protease YdiL (CAAX protease family)